MKKRKFISGIHNYCDRWCERCIFTLQCRVFENTGELSAEEVDANNEASWKKIGENFEKAIKLLHKAANERGIDLDNVMSKEESEEYERQQSLIRKSAKSHLLTQLCEKYRNLVKPFFQEQLKPKLIEQSGSLVKNVEIGIETEEGVKDFLASVEDCHEIIMWYFYFIGVKFQRALHGKLEGEQWEVENGFQKDSDGSAKIAILSIDKCMAAWAKLFELMPASEDTALKALALLSKIKEAAFHEFPDAMKFKRPGFDD